MPPVIPLADHHDVWGDAVLRDAPHLAGAHQAGLDFVGDVERIVTIAQLPDPRQITFMRHGEAVGCGDGLHDDGSRVAALERVLHRVEVVERHLDELAQGVLGEERPGEAFVTGLDRQARMSVIRLDDGDDLALARGVARRLDGQLHRLGPASAVDGVLQAVGGAGRERFGQSGPRERGEVVVAHVEAPGAGVQHFDQLGIAVAEVVGAAVQVDVDQTAAVEVVEAIAFTAIDHQIDAGVLPELRLVRVPEGLRRFEEFELRRLTPSRLGLGMPRH